MLPSEQIWWEHWGCKAQFPSPGFPCSLWLLRLLFPKEMKWSQNRIYTPGASQCHRNGNTVNAQEQEGLYSCPFLISMPLSWSKTFMDSSKGFSGCFARAGLLQVPCNSNLHCKFKFSARFCTSATLISQIWTSLGRKVITVHCVIHLRICAAWLLSVFPENPDGICLPGCWKQVSV